LRATKLIISAMKKTTYLLMLSFFISLAAVYPSSEKTIKVLTIKDKIINPVTAEYIKDNLERAKKENCSALIIRLNTPGGLLKSTQEIVRYILNSKIPIITYVSPKGARAASAGTFIGCASSILAMAPSTHIGAAHPVLGGGAWGKVSEEMRKKIMNDTLAWAKNISEERNRPYKFLENAVKNSISITEKEALKQKIIDLTAENLPNLINKIDGKKIEINGKEITLEVKGSKIEFTGLTGRQEFLNTLLDPQIAYLLFILGFLGLIFEVTHPGFGVPGIAGIICLIMSLYAFSSLPVNYAGIALIVIGITFFIIEAFTPTFGLFTLAGLVAFILGSTLLFRGPHIFKVEFKLIMPMAAAIALWSLFILSKVIQIRLKHPRTGKESMLNETGTALTNFHKRGKVSIHGETWNAESAEDIKKGEEVEVTGIKGLTIKVTRKSTAFKEKGL